MTRKRVFGKVRLTREEREGDRRIWEATKDEPLLKELEQRLGPGEPVTDPDTVVFRLGISHKIAVAREDAGLTQAELAEELGMDQASISAAESGAGNMTLETLGRIAKVLGLKVTLEPVRKQ
jgi:DNA-binding XRE family transcriptional regulator